MRVRFPDPDERVCSPELLPRTLQALFSVLDVFFFFFFFFFFLFLVHGRSFPRFVSVVVFIKRLLYWSQIKLLSKDKYRSSLRFWEEFLPLVITSGFLLFCPPKCFFQVLLMTRQATFQSFFPLHPASILSTYPVEGTFPVFFLTSPTSEKRPWLLPPPSIYLWGVLSADFCSPSPSFPVHFLPPTYLLRQAQSSSDPYGPGLFCVGRSPPFNSLPPPVIPFPYGDFQLLRAQDGSPLPMAPYFPFSRTSLQTLFSEARVDRSFSFFFFPPI